MSATLFDTFVEMSVGQAAAYGDKTALEFEGRQLSYAALDALSNQIAHALIGQGIQHGDHISYLGKNSAVYYAILLACAKTGAILTPVNWRLAPAEISFILNDSQARLMFVGSEFLDAAVDLQPTLETCKTIISYEKQSEHFPHIDDWIANSPDTLPEVAIAETDVLVQLYTSGTTGNPKGVMLAHQNLLKLRRAAAEVKTPWNEWNNDDVSLIGMPCFHIGGTGWGMATLLSGATGVVTREFNPHEVLDYIEQFRISKIFMVPAAMQLVINHPRALEVDYSCIKYMLYGASPIPQDLLRKCMDVFQCGFVQMYGMTEASGTVVALPPEDHDPNGNARMRSAGKAVPGVELAIMGDNGELLPPGQTGEILVKSPSNMTGYWNLAEVTAETLPDDGWLRTGDAGELDEDGYLFIHDRVKDMIISGGENIYPTEVENAIFSHDEVADVAIIGIPSEQWGEAVTAFVVRKPKSSISESDIIDFARTKIASFKCPKAIHFIDELPRNPAGKILRRVLREPFWEGKRRGIN